MPARKSKAAAAAPAKRNRSRKSAPTTPSTAAAAKKTARKPRPAAATGQRATGPAPADEQLQLDELPPAGQDNCDLYGEDDFGDGPGPRRRGKQKGPTLQQLREEARRKAYERRMDLRRREWAAYPFAGTRYEKAQKRDVLAHIEEYFAPSMACAEAGVLRSKFAGWVERDPRFAAAVQSAQSYCIDEAESYMFRLAIGRVDAGVLNALFGILNAHHPGYGVIKAQQLQRVLARWIDHACGLIRQHVDVETADRLREVLMRGADVASRAPSSRRLKRG